MQIQTRIQSREGAEITTRSVISARTVPTQRRVTVDEVAVDAAAVDVAMAVDEETVMAATSPATIVE